MRACITFTRGMMHMPVPWQLWLLLLVTVNLILPLVYLDRLEAQVVVGTMVASMLLMTGLTARTGFTRLLGLGHMAWVPLLVFLWTRLDGVPADDGFGIWMRLLMALNALSLVIDTVDVIRYIAGDRAETVVV